jgi:hypothetical protein
VLVSYDTLAMKVQWNVSFLETLINSMEFCEGIAFSGFYREVSTPVPDLPKRKPTGFKLLSILPHALY